MSGAEGGVNRRGLAHDPRAKNSYVEQSLAGRAFRRFRHSIRFYVGTHNENPPFIEQKRVFDSLGEDLGNTCSGTGVCISAILSASVDMFFCLVR
jgi:hypothetical protein